MRKCIKLVKHKHVFPNIWRGYNTERDKLNNFGFWFKTKLSV